MKYVNSKERNFILVHFWTKSCLILCMVFIILSYVLQTTNPLPGSSKYACYWVAPVLNQDITNVYQKYLCSMPDKAAVGIIFNVFSYFAGWAICLSLGFTSIELRTINFKIDMFLYPIILLFDFKTFKNQTFCKCVIKLTNWQTTIKRWKVI